MFKSDYKKIETYIFNFNFIKLWYNSFSLTNVGKIEMVEMNNSVYL